MTATRHVSCSFKQRRATRVVQLLQQPQTGAERACFWAADVIVNARTAALCACKEVTRAGARDHPRPRPLPKAYQRSRRWALVPLALCLPRGV